MGRLVKLEDFDKTRYTKVYHYVVNADIQPIMMYKDLNASKHVYHIANIEICQMRYVAEMIYAMFHEQGKKKIVIRCETYDKFNIEFYAKDSIFKIYDKLTFLDKAYFLANNMQ